ncbi:hypothetical protein [Candidatus Nitrosocosmicus sp. SS]|jgi:FlaG/FlaF family flagellin (archaellin)|uniref:hypothetical protein n=1 Tax=Candidatus Nitrosocosmicus agrestis TaxID=2563600 RepID=UPI00122DED75|nr:hypothetical protein [Candidatus Nitrosocosmicus sp. SS]KAA2283371.1 hypothetical protein F1Z66_02435 [Candidatus Nitrosocosmicus sp. SS]KAF0868983.1 hypothetical protein E5N71_08295 [Candidatus Nitrosocosmicus sp. SS]
MSTKTNKIGMIAVMFIAAALIGSVVTFGDNNMAFATGKHNDAEQEIEQGQDSEQNGQCVSGEFTALCGNNFNLQLQEQLGNLALGQQ